MTAKPVLGISIVNYFSSSEVAQLVHSIIDSLDDTPAVISIVDNSTDENNAEQTNLVSLANDARSSNVEVHIVKAPANLGYGAGNNLATEVLLAKAVDFIWIINPDIVVRGKISDLVTEMSGQPSGIWATQTVENGKQGSGFGRLNTLTGRGATHHGSKSRTNPLSITYPAGHSMLFRRSAWETVGGFDERYFLFMEEADLTLRAIHSGIAIGQVESVYVLHSQGLTTGSTQNLLSKSPVAYRESTRSRILFFRRFFPLRLPALILFRLLYAILVNVRGNRAGSKAVLEGLISGLQASPDKYK